MARDFRAAIEAALEVARRPTTSPGERDAAINGAMRLIERSGADPDSFDIPGRSKLAGKRADRIVVDDPLGDLYGFKSTTESVLRSFEEALRRRQREEFDPFSASVRAEQAKRERAGFNAGVKRLAADLALGFLWERDVRAYPTVAALDGGRRFVIPEESALEYDEDGVVEVARRHGWGAEERAAFSHPFAVQAAQFLRGRGLSVTANPDGASWTIQGDGISYFDKCAHSMLLALARQRGWTSRGAAE